jgi:hypothetical protein
LKSSVICQEQEQIKKGFYLKLEQNYVPVKPRTTIQLAFNVERVGQYKEAVTLTADKGDLEPAEGFPDFSGKWTIGGLETPGKYEFNLEANGVDGISREEKLTVQVEGEHRFVEVDSLNLKYAGYTLYELKPQSLSSFRLAADTLNKLGLAGKAYVKLKIEEKIKFEADGLGSEIVSFLTQRFEECIEKYGLVGEAFQYNGRVALNEQATIDDKIISNFRSLEKKAVFVLRE